MAFDLKKEEDVKEFIENLGVEYSFGCYSEKKPEVCHLLGEYNESVKKDFAKAGKLFKINCDDYKYARSCHQFAGYTLVGKGLPKESPTEAYNYYKKGCELGYANSCGNAGIMATNESTKTPELINHTKGVEDLQKGCELGSANACYFLSGLFISGSKDGKSIPKDMSQAFKYAQLGCNLDNIYSCANLSMMYKKGDGVEKNEKLSEEMKKKALELQKQHNDSLTLNYQRGIET